MHNVRRLAMAARAEATEMAGKTGGEGAEGVEGGGTGDTPKLRTLQANITSALGVLKAKAKRGEVGEMELHQMGWDDRPAQCARLHRELCVDPQPKVRPLSSPYARPLTVCVAALPRPLQGGRDRKPWDAQ